MNKKEEISKSVNAVLQILEHPGKPYLVPK